MDLGELHTQRLVLSRITANDLDNIHKLHLEPLVAKYNTIGIPKTPQDTFGVIQGVLDDLPNPNPSQFGWIITTLTGTFIGEIGLKLAPIRYKKGEIHFSLMPVFWGNGYALEAAQAVIDFGFNTLDLRRLEAGVAISNTKSVALIERLGMQREGQHREILPIAQGWTDNYSYAILKSDLNAK